MSLQKSQVHRLVLVRLFHFNFVDLLFCLQTMMQSNVHQTITYATVGTKPLLFLLILSNVLTTKSVGRSTQITQCTDGWSFNFDQFSHFWWFINSSIGFEVRRIRIGFNHSFNHRYNLFSHSNRNDSSG